MAEENGNEGVVEQVMGVVVDVGLGVTVDEAKIAKYRIG